MKGFGSDNHSGVHPRYLDAMIRANTEHAPSYGTDEHSEKAATVFRSHFGDVASTHFVFNGTAANVLAIGAMIESFHSVIASAQAHLLNDECGAPEKIIGCKTISIPTPDGKLRPELIKPFLVRRGDQHYSQAKVLTLTQPTEVGTVYSLDELKALGEFAKREGLLVHIDGARYVNAAASLGCSLRAMSDACGADVLSFGGTKNGLLFGEAIVFLKPNTDRNFKYLRKQTMQLPSKTRFIAAQFVEFLGTDLWLENAKIANARAQSLYRGLSRIASVEITQVPGANSVFVKLPREWIAPLREIGFFYVWDERTFECRLMTTWDTDEDDIERFIKKVQELNSNAGATAR